MAAVAVSVKSHSAVLPGLRGSGHLFQAEVDLPRMQIPAEHVRKTEVATPEVVLGPPPLDNESVAVQVRRTQWIERYKIARMHLAEETPVASRATGQRVATSASCAELL